MLPGIEKNRKANSGHLARRINFFHQHIVFGAEICHLFVRQTNTHGLRHEVALRRTVDDCMRQGLIAGSVDGTHLSVGNIAPETIAGDLLPSRACFARSVRGDDVDVALALDAHQPIAVKFLGSATGNITVNSNASVFLNG